MKNVHRERIGLFGGSFHPPHQGHVEAARIFLERARPDRLLIIPVFLPPHKKLASGATAEDRFEMARLAFEPLGAAVEVSDLELRRREACYTLDTLRAVREEHPEAELCLYVGSDMLFSFETWHEYQTVLSLCRLFVLAREGDLEKCEQKAKELRQSANAEIEVMGECLCVSSGEIRERLLRGEDDERVPEPVLEYIKRCGLYRAAEGN